jgi:hypothetical protein
MAGFSSALTHGRKAATHDSAEKARSSTSDSEKDHIDASLDHSGRVQSELAKKKVSKNGQASRLPFVLGVG